MRRCTKAAPGTGGLLGSACLLLAACGAAEGLAALDVAGLTDSSDAAPAKDAAPATGSAAMGSDATGVGTTCGNGACEATESGASCAKDCCKCGDGKCTAECESTQNCLLDCKATCGNAVCEAGENPVSCREDCCGVCGDGTCAGGACGEGNKTKKDTYCEKDCGTGCGNQKCEGGENPDNCPEDCKFKACGNKLCEGGEDPKTCPQDCGSTCGDCACDKGETPLNCPVDCGWCGDKVCRSAKTGAGLFEEQSCPGDCLTVTCKEGEDNAVCDDGNLCSLDSCDKTKGACVHLPKDKIPCNDGNICTTADTCLAQECVGIQNPCNDNNPCTKDSCDPKKECLHEHLTGKACDDNSNCTKNDACLDGLCTGAAIPCVDESPCTQNVLCDKTTGCLYAAEPAGTPCSDGSKCTTGDACQGKVCSGATVACNDGSPCTIDNCDKATGCAYDVAAGATCTDGNACTVGDTCNGLGVCGVFTLKNCDDGNPCALDSCHPLQGCQHTAIYGLACDDGSACTINDQCAGSVCAGTAKNCNDDNPCTLDACAAATGCVALPASGTPCNDNNACTSGDVCGAGSCLGPKPTDCDDGNPCTVDTCDPAGGCKKALLDKVACDDKNPCTVGDACGSGVCKATERLFQKVGAINGSFDDRIAAVRPLPGGGIVVVGSKQKAYLYKSFQTDLVIKKYNAAGVLVFDQEVTAEVNNNFVGDVAVRADGGLFIVGAEDGVASFVDPVPKGHRAQWWRVETDNTSATGTKVADTNARLNAVVRLGDDTLLAVGYEMPKGLLMRFSADGKTATKTTAVGESSGNMLRAVAMVPGTLTQVVAAGVQTVGGNDAPWLTRLDANGKTMWTANFPTSSAQVNLNGVALWTQGILAVGSSQAPNESTHPYVLATDLNGKTLWSKVYSQDDGALASVVMTNAGVGLLMGVANNFSQALIRRVDVLGNDLADTFLVVGNAASGLGAAALDPDGLLLYSGNTFSWSVLHSNDAFWGRMDVFGNVDCASSGVCTDAKTGTCDDGNPCTVDACTAKAGCSHAAMITGSLCGVGQTCGAGVCK